MLALLACVNYLDADAGAPAGQDAASDTAGDSPCGYDPYACAVLDAGPVLYLRFDETKGSTAMDFTGNGNNGTYPIGGSTLGAKGALVNEPDTAVYLDGTHGIGMPTGVADFAGKSPEFTVELWVNLDADGGDLSGIGYLIDHETQGPTAPKDGWAVLLTGGSVQISFWASGNTLGVATQMPNLLTPSQWHHVVGVCFTTEQDLYIDGVPQTPHNTSLGAGWPDIGSWMIGNENCQCSPQGLTGSIDELAIYPRALSESEIKSHYMIATQ